MIIQFAIKHTLALESIVHRIIFINVAKLQQENRKKMFHAIERKEHNQPYCFHFGYLVIVLCFLMPARVLWRSIETIKMIFLNLWLFCFSLLSFTQWLGAGSDHFHSMNCIVSAFSQLFNEEERQKKIKTKILKRRRSKSISSTNRDMMIRVHDHIIGGVSYKQKLRRPTIVGIENSRNNEIFRSNRIIYHFNCFWRCF